MVYNTAAPHSWLQYGRLNTLKRVSRALGGASVVPGLYQQDSAGVKSPLQPRGNLPPPLPRDDIKHALRSSVVKVRHTVIRH